MSNLPGAIRLLESLADERLPNTLPHLSQMAREVLEHIRELERKLEVPLVQGPNNEGSHG